ncbi:BTAD domain-containing putative transcriptional regulator [Dactylosporangium sp. AC04546]|uniref:AfsR/SARP family transcriptional regulator n=1 Tax=Dactylosporangium sp. AC04546 TaxID=2862460 RepID=UPI001EDF87CF|nr:BTAD domain-containing putative transcriptional regulator [Dactylosporangium sp. AC04546]WVK81537.1 BTAD domain-containing putative transcriptional regulator [Dactylosporangium sp. AC04546]
MKRVEIRALGGFHILAGGADVTCPPTHAERLVRLLVRTGGTADLSSVTGVMWPGTPARTARRRLRNVLARLRERYGGIVRRQGDLLVLDAPVDVFRLAAAAEAVAGGGLGPGATELRACAGLWRGDLFAGDDASSLEGARERTRQQYLMVLDRLADLAAAEGRVLDEVYWLDRAYRTAPHDERRIVRIVARLAATGHEGRAREAFALGCDVSTELGVRIPPALAAAAAVLATAYRRVPAAVGVAAVGVAGVGVAAVGVAA